MSVAGNRFNPQVIPAIKGIRNITKGISPLFASTISEDMILSESELAELKNSQNEL
jgi:hypothetical protein